jgi:hypothetical protein
VHLEDTNDLETLIDELEELFEQLTPVNKFEVLKLKARRFGEYGHVVDLNESLTSLAQDTFNLMRHMMEEAGNPGRHEQMKKIQQELDLMVKIFIRKALDYHLPAGLGSVENELDLFPHRDRGLNEALSLVRSSSHVLSEYLDLANSHDALNDGINDITERVDAIVDRGGESGSLSVD